MKYLYVYNINLDKKQVKKSRGSCSILRGLNFSQCQPEMQDKFPEEHKESCEGELAGC